ncbi:phosphatidylglycerophosphatase A [Chitinivorax tropicus]|uniref:Phosphatidylglycerophosphatase A n=1 Tax=Chitinivorax tropicus TaxID=714531 RepID=A0A840MN95_9PROT|nr:phosphatidylglycerophosphatase A [Chitinivorax tropicus]MBB5017653.1 phosphatidylglycerophosphatase A [Chitinivorax tropicus]
MAHPAHFLAFGFGSGLSPKAPGTFGTLAAFPVYALLITLLPPMAVWAVIAVMCVVGVWICDVAGRAVGVADHGGIVWDEIAGFCLVLAFVPVTAVWWAVAFGLFRLFDIWKPFPIRQLDARTHNGLGVMLDDMLAAVYSIVVAWGLQQTAWLH